MALVFNGRITARLGNHLKMLFDKHNFNRNCASRVTRQSMRFLGYLKIIASILGLFSTPGWAFEELEKITLPPADKPNWNYKTGDSFLVLDHLSNKKYTSSVTYSDTQKITWKSTQGYEITNTPHSPGPPLELSNESYSATYAHQVIKDNFWPIRIGSAIEIKYTIQPSQGEKIEDIEKCKIIDAIQIKGCSGIVNLAT